MKIFILLLALGLCLADAVPGGYQQIDAAEAQADPTIQSYIQAGLKAVVQNANNKGFFSNSDFELTQINSVYEQVVNGINYKFDCNFTDSNGVILRANFVVSHSASTNVTTVPSFSYKVYYPPTTTTTTTVTPSNTTVEAAGETVTDGDTTAVTPAEEETEGFVMPVEEAIMNDNGEAINEEEAVAEAAEEATVESPEEVTVVPEEENISVAPEEENTEETTPTAPVVVVSADGFTAISADEYAQSEDLQKYFAFGFQTVVQNGINANKIPNTTFASAQVLSASEKTAKNGQRYKFTAQASNGNNVDLNLTFEVAYQVPSYSYTVKITTTTPTNNTGSGSGSNSTNTTVPVIPDTGSNTNTTNSTVPVIPDTGSQNSTNNTGSNNNNTNTNTTSDGWVNVDVAQVQTNAEIQSNLVTGFSQVIDAAVLKKSIQADNYTITQVVSAARKNLTNGVNYKFNVKGQNDDGNTVLEMNYTTYYRYSNKSVKTVAYNYKYSIKNIPIPAQNNTNSGSNQTNTTTGNTNTTTPVNNTTNTTVPVDNTNTTVPVNNTNTTVPVNNTNTTVPVNNTTNSTNTTTPTANNTNGYVALSADQIQGQDVQNALNYGSAQVVQLGQQNGKIPAGTYNLTQVASVLKKIQPAGANYNCTVTLKNAANVTVSTNFNVYTNSTSNASILKAYSYQVTGIKKN